MFRHLLLCLLLVPLLMLLAPSSTLGQDAEGDDTAQATEADTDAAAEQEAVTDEDADEEVTAGMAFVRKLQQGGWTIVFLLLLSVFGVACAIERALRLRRTAIVPPGLADQADRLWQKQQFDQVAALRSKHPSTMGDIVAALAKHRRSDTSDLNTIAGDIASRDLRRHLGKAYPLAIVATLAPLLGLLGTIIGMIGAFDKVHAAGTLGDAGMLGGDISKALITTGVGLGVALPALALYHFFKSRTLLLGIILEEEVSELMTSWFVHEEDETPADDKNDDKAKQAEEPAGKSTEVNHAG